jgi:hypothetical protein
MRWFKASFSYPIWPPVPIKPNLYVPNSCATDVNESVLQWLLVFSKSNTALQ